MFSDEEEMTKKQAIRRRKRETNAMKEEAHDLIDASEGSFALVALNYREGEAEAHAAHIMVVAVGTIEDMARLSSSLRTAEKQLMKDMFTKADLGDLLKIVTAKEEQNRDRN